MLAEEIRALQAPLKAQYREDPDSARWTLRATGEIGDRATCRIETHPSPVVAGLHPATGGNGLEACSGDMMLQALVACAGVTMGAVATAMGIELRRGTVTAEGELDFRGTLGVSKDAPVGFSEIRLSFDLDTDADREKLDTLLRLTERYCVVFQTLNQPPKLSAGYSVAG